MHLVELRGCVEWPRYGADVPGGLLGLEVNTGLRLAAADGLVSGSEDESTFNPRSLSGNGSGSEQILVVASSRTPRFSAAEQQLFRSAPPGHRDTPRFFTQMTQISRIRFVRLFALTLYVTASHDALCWL